MWIILSSNFGGVDYSHFLHIAQTEFYTYFLNREILEFCGLKAVIHIFTPTTTITTNFFYNLFIKKTTFTQEGSYTHNENHLQQKQFTKKR